MGWENVKSSREREKNERTLQFAMGLLLNERLPIGYRWRIFGNRRLMV